MKYYFRSKVMVLYRIYFPFDSVYSVLAQLGEVGLVQFVDLNEGKDVTKLRCFSQICECDSMEAQLKYLKQEILKSKIPIIDNYIIPDAPPIHMIPKLKSTIGKLNEELDAFNKNLTNFRQNKIEISDIRAVINLWIRTVSDNITYRDSFIASIIQDEYKRRAADFTTGVENKLSYFCGVMKKMKYFAFERVMWRVFHGTYYLVASEIENEDPDEERKFGFILFFHSEVLKGKFKKILSSFGAVLVPFPEDILEQREMLRDINNKLVDLSKICNETDELRIILLKTAAEKLKIWSIQIKKVKAICFILNHLRVNRSGSLLIGEIWLPRTELPVIQACLYQETLGSSVNMPPILERIYTDDDPPTYNRSNKFTYAFQKMIDAYGIATYRELNPMPYTIITFPFLFAIMFGDIGHGLILVLFSGWMIMKEQKFMNKESGNEIWKIMFGGRYVIFLMGLFSMYTGLIYNDIFAKSFVMFSPSWTNSFTFDEIVEERSRNLDPRIDYRLYPYSVGIDPVWELALENKIIFQNSIKMKVSIILGVIQMFFGLCLSAINLKYFKEKINIFLEVIPSMLFLMCLFGYLCIMVIIKWFKYSGENEAPDNITCAPSILITFINMMLQKENPILFEECVSELYPYQTIVQYVLLLLGILSIPVLLLGHPLHVRSERKKRAAKTGLGATKKKTKQQKDEDEDTPPEESPKKPAAYLPGYDTPKYDDIDKMTFGVTSKLNVESEDDLDYANRHGHEKPMSEVFIYQGIHTIESVLGAVSHTASYLRLWALSLAHNQLSSVLWAMVFRIGLVAKGYSGPIILWAIFCFWAILTVLILVIMEGLSAFLHTLRLHWVEFQSKFYGGAGYLFEPFSFKEIISK